ncbi:MAG: hypothetical protein DWQ19_10220 [Crenarchaeota archaeon]|nr:MAG: hypothetical protein DWQ19_10220 [Thermoproteota archaeon]
MKKLRKLQDSNFYLSTKYESYRPCQNGSNCCDNDYCRCERIIDPRIDEDVDGCQITAILCSIKGRPPIDVYCIERILTINKIWDAGNWDVIVRPGYYGEEISGCQFRWGELVDKQIETALNFKTNRAKIEYILKLEYGHLLPEVQGKRWLIKKVDKNDVVFGQKLYHEKLDQSVIEKYQDYPFPRGICLFQDGKYRIIDGYHRLAAGEDKVKIIWAKA